MTDRFNRRASKIGCARFPNSNPQVTSGVPCIECICYFRCRLILYTDFFFSRLPRVRTPEPRARAGPASYRLSVRPRMVFSDSPRQSSRGARFSVLLARRRVTWFSAIAPPPQHPHLSDAVGSSSSSSSSSSQVYK